MKVVVCPIIFKVLYIQGGQDFFHRQYHKKTSTKISASKLPLLLNDVSFASGDGGFAAGGTTCLAPHEVQSLFCCFEGRNPKKKHGKNVYAVFF